uniref:Uncharacterized protein n=1 Tax=Manihot esculenta TaxID=3983 RepID=A0A2C9VEE8_MANES
MINNKQNNSNLTNQLITTKLKIMIWKRKNRTKIIAMKNLDNQTIKDSNHTIIDAWFCNAGCQALEKWKKVAVVHFGTGNNIYYGVKGSLLTYGANCQRKYRCWGLWRT